MGRVILDELTRLTASEFTLQILRAMKGSAHDGVVPLDVTRLGERVELEYPKSELSPSASVTVHLVREEECTRVLVEVGREEPGTDVPQLAERFIRRLLATNGPP